MNKCASHIALVKRNKLLREFCSETRKHKIKIPPITANECIHFDHFCLWFYWNDILKVSYSKYTHYDFYYYKPTNFHLLALEMREDSDIVQSVIMDFKLFRIVSEKNEFFSFEVGKDIERKKELSQKRSKSADKRWDKEKKHHPPTPPVTPTPHVRSDEVAPLPEQQLAKKSEEAAEQELPTFACSMENECKDCKKTIHGNRCILNFSESVTFKKLYKPSPLSKEEAKDIVQKTVKKETNPLTDEEQAEYDKLLSYFFFERHIKNANAECSRFWNFYQSTKWKDSKGRKVIDRVARAKLWNTGDAPQFTSDVTAFVYMLRDIFNKTSHSISLSDFIKGIVKIEVKPNTVLVCCTDQISHLVIKNYDIIKKDFEKMYYKDKTLQFINEEEKQKQETQMRDANAVPMPENLELINKLVGKVANKSKTGDDKSPENNQK